MSDRLRELLQDLDARHEGANILLVSHGDCLQILQATVVSDSDCRMQRLCVRPCQVFAQPCDSSFA